MNKAEVVECIDRECSRPLRERPFELFVPMSVSSAQELLPELQRDLADKFPALRLAVMGGRKGFGDVECALAQAIGSEDAFEQIRDYEDELRAGDIPREALFVCGFAGLP